MTNAGNHGYQCREPKEPIQRTTVTSAGNHRDQCRKPARPGAVAETLKVALNQVKVRGHQQQEDAKAMQSTFCASLCASCCGEDVKLRRHRPSSFGSPPSCSEVSAAPSEENRVTLGEGCLCFDTSNIFIVVKWKFLWPQSNPGSSYCPDGTLK